jgi:hypothetical protein
VSKADQRCASSFVGKVEIGIAKPVSSAATSFPNLYLVCINETPVCTDDSLTAWINVTPALRAAAGKKSWIAPSFCGACLADELCGHAT